MVLYKGFDGAGKAYVRCSQEFYFGSASRLWKRLGGTRAINPDSASLRLSSRTREYRKRSLLPLTFGARILEILLRSRPNLHGRRGPHRHAQGCARKIFFLCRRETAGTRLPTFSVRTMPLHLFGAATALQPPASHRASLT